MKNMWQHLFAFFLFTFFFSIAPWKSFFFCFWYMCDYNFYFMICVCVCTSWSVFIYFLRISYPVNGIFSIFFISFSCCFSVLGFFGQARLQFKLSHSFSHFNGWIYSFKYLFKSGFKLAKPFYCSFSAFIPHNYCNVAMHFHI